MIGEPVCVSWSAVHSKKYIKGGRRQVLKGDAVAFAVTEKRN